MLQPAVATETEVSQVHAYLRRVAVRRGDQPLYSGITMSGLISRIEEGIVYAIPRAAIASAIEAIQRRGDVVMRQDAPLLYTAMLIR